MTKKKSNPKLKKNKTPKKMSIIDHLVELRNRLLLASNGSLIAYAVSPFDQYWDFEDSGQLKSDRLNIPPYYLIMQSDNNLVIYNGIEQAVWDINTHNSGYNCVEFIIKNSGNLVVQTCDTTNITLLWNSNTILITTS